jgi:acetylornithine deacetylase/succinyl-diaminopimelate desuccinylase-like protein
MTPYEYLDQNKDTRFNELFELLRFPSVSAKSEHNKDSLACAEWLKNHLNSIGFKAALYPTTCNPLVYAEYFVSDKLPTILYYGHYDVQPAEPFDLWTTPPFEPQIRDGYIYARGSCDDKGQTFTHIKGLQAILKTSGTLPVNVKFLIEGHEEGGNTVDLSKFIKEQKQLLKADIVVVSDTSQFNKDLPAVTFGLRGISSVEVWVHGPDRDLHSGSFGGAVGNPVNILCEMIGQLHDKNGKILVPGFYKDCKLPTAWERKQFKRLPYNEAKYKKAVGVPALYGEKQYSTHERTWVRPTLDVNGIKGGYQGEGGKTIIPSVASAKITMRLVPNMKPADIARKLEKFFKKIAPKCVKVEMVFHGGAEAVVVPTDGPWLEAAGRAIKTGFGKTPVFMKEGGSIPVAGDFKASLGLDTIFVGFGQNDDNIHSPNERFRVTDFERGCRTAIALPYEFATVKK